MIEDDEKNNVIAILTYCDTENKAKVLVDNIKFIRNNYSDFKIVIHANYPLSEKIQKLVDIYIYEDLNFISNKSIVVWTSLTLFDKTFYTTLYEEYGYSVFQMIKSLAQRLIKYKKVLLINYDLVIENVYINNHKNLNNDLIIYGREEGCYLTVMSFNPFIFTNKISCQINYQSYMNLGNIISENIFYHYIKNSNINFVKIDYYVKDKISSISYSANENSFFTENFISINNNNLEIYLWGIIIPIKDIKIEIDNNEYLLENKNNRNGFENILFYDNKISNIKIIEINSNNVNIPLRIIKNSRIENGIKI